jgi:hypothetical protein
VTRRNHTLSVYSRDESRAFTPAELSTIRAEFARFLQTWNYGWLANTPYQAAIARGDGRLVRVNSWAVAHDVLAIGAIGIVIIGTRRFKAERKERIARRAVERLHRCPRCGYDITGMLGVCPECGTPLMRDG